MPSALSQIRKQRLKKVKKLREMGINPYPARSKRSHKNKELIENFDIFEGKEVIVVGRIMSHRKHGSLKFADIQDFTGRIQIIVKRDDLKQFDKKEQLLGWNETSLLDIGDYIQVSGNLIKSKTGEISVNAKELKLLTKSIRPLPEKWEGIKDKEKIFRRRYLDLTMKPERKIMFNRKSHFWEVNRKFLKNKGFIEVETPVLEHVTGGADAKPFITHHNALDEDFYLRISTELYLKRLIGGGYEKVFTFGPNFRNEGIDDEHLQEYMQIEWYWAYADFRDNMKMLVEMFRHIAKEVYGTTKFKRKEHEFNLADNWVEVDYVKIIKEKLGIDIFKDKDDKMKLVLDKKGVELESGTINRMRLIDNLWKVIRKDISGPAFLINEPKFMSPLAKSSPDNEAITERFHIILAGSENGNGYTEVNDPIDQYERFAEQQAARDAGDDEAQMMDIDYVEMLEYGMPPVSGYAHSERLFWFLEDSPARECVFFPQTKYYISENTKEIYGIEEPRKITSVLESKFSKKISHLRNTLTKTSLSQIDNSEIITIDKNLCKKFDNLNVGIAIIKGIKVEKNKPDLDNLKREVIKGISTSLNAEDIDDLPNIESYHEMYEQMGIDTNSRKSSPEAMLRRIVEGKELYSVNTCVDAYNLAVILTQVSAGAFNLEEIESPVVIREAKDGEEIEIIGGEKKKLKEGEVCYFDQKGAYNMDFNFRDAERTKVTEKTKDILINVEGVNSITREQVADALKLTVDLITRFCGGEVEMIGMVKSASSKESERVEKAKYTIEKAEKLLREYVKNDSLINHCQMVAFGMKEFAKKYNENIDTWYITGLLHDFDYERWPEEHPVKGKSILEKEGVDKSIIKAIQGHNLETGVERDTNMAKILYAIDELIGLMTAVALMRPNKFQDMKVSSVMKKFKDKNFAAKVSREEIRLGSKELGIELEDLVYELIEIFKSYKKAKVKI